MVYEKVISTLDLPKEEWLKVRKQGIGGSDIGAIVGVNKWSSPFNVYMDKTTDYTDDLSENEAVYWGTVLEDIVAKEFARRTGKKVHRLNAVLRSVETPFALANVDRMVAHENAGLECKTTNAFSKDEWSDDEAPPSYILQCQWYMYVTGCKKWYIACLIGGQKFVCKLIERDDELINYLVERATNFWENNVLKNIPPKADGSKGCTEYIKKTYDKDCGEEVPFTSDIIESLDRLSEIKVLSKELEKEQTAIENNVKLYLEDNAGGYSDKYTVTWKTQRGKPKLKLEELVRDYGIEDLSEYYEESTIRRFTVKINK